MAKTQKSFRVHIGFFGRRNVGKSSLINLLTAQQTSIVSEVPGTTTDTVNKPMELQPLGPVQLIDTAGTDDVGELGQKRVARTKKAIQRSDLAVLIFTDNHWGEPEEQLMKQFAAHKTPVVIVHNKSDLNPMSAALKSQLQRRMLPVLETAAARGEGRQELRQLLVKHAPRNLDFERTIVADLVQPGQHVFLVVPIDKEAPKGRLISPQVQTLRELLDADNIITVVKERELGRAFAALKEPPSLVITDSQAFMKVAADTPPGVPMTSFSILFSRFKGDLRSQVMALKQIEKLKNGDSILVAEACSHHPVGEDIGRVKIPRWLRNHTGKELHFETIQGHDFPENLEDYALVIQCGACMWNSKEVGSRLSLCRERGVPMTNYGLVIAYSLGIIERALGPFPDVLNVFQADDESRVTAAAETPDREALLTRYRTKL
jgi:[FeFe] hydrogenase H-cluster maturation GTPase HydF